MLGNFGELLLELVILAGVGPVKNKPSTDKLYNFINKQMLCNVTHDI